MNFIAKFVASLSDAELTQLSNSVYDETSKRTKERVSHFKLSHLVKAEQRMMRRNKINAIKMYKDRMQCSLLEAKTLIEKLLAEEQQIIEMFVKGLPPVRWPKILPKDMSAEDGEPLGVFEEYSSEGIKHEAILVRMFDEFKLSFFRKDTGVHMHDVVYNPPANKWKNVYPEVKV